MEEFTGSDIKYLAGIATLICLVSTLSPLGFGYILGNPTLLITRDGGRRWTALKFPSTLNPTAVSFVNPATGWLTTGNNVLYRTTNGGITWQPMVN